MPRKKSIQSIGIVGFGAFGRLIADHLKDHFTLCIHDASIVQFKDNCLHNHMVSDMQSIAKCDLIILAVPIGALRDVLCELRPYLRAGTIIVDVCSVKIKPVEIMKAELPAFVEIVGTHPLFGPQSAKNAIAGLKMVLCPVRGKSVFRIAAFLKHVLRLQVFMETPEKHDRDMATVQGLTHLIARTLMRMEPFPTRLTTASFDLLVEAIDMVRHDAETVYHAIERENPHAKSIRELFFQQANDIQAKLEDNHKKEVNTQYVDFERRITG